MFSELLKRSQSRTVPKYWWLPNKQEGRSTVVVLRQKASDVGLGGQELEE
jgi:hypothetical protein